MAVVLRYHLLGFICLFYNADVVYGKDIHVAVNGLDRPNCGKSADTPCQSLTHVSTKVEDGDIIYIDAKGTLENPTWACSPTALLFKVSVSIIGVNGKPIVGCEEGNNHRLLMMNLSNTEANQTYEYHLSNLQLQNVLMIVENPTGNISVVMNNMRVIDSKWHSPPNNPETSLYFIDSEWQGSMDDNCTVSCQPTSMITMGGVFLRVRIHRSVFLHNILTITAESHADFEVTESYFSSVPDIPSTHGEIYLIMKNSLEYSRVVVTDTIFENQVYSDPIDSIMNLYRAAFMVRAVHPSRGPKGMGVVEIENCIFRNNERGLTFIGPFNRTDVKNCTFHGNIAMHAGAAILYLTDPEETHSYVTNCTFYNNDAGAFRPEKLINYEDKFQIIGDEARIQSECCKGLIAFVGKGGAIRIQTGKLTLTDCYFINNTARLLGGAIFVDRESTMYVENVYFENSPIERHALQGDIFYSNGLVVIRSARLMILTARNHMTLVRHSGDHWSIDVNDVAIQCPVGYRLRVTNTSAYGVTPIGLRRSYKLDQLSYFCESCPRHKYSLDYGYLNYSLSYISFAYFTLLIDGSEPERAYTGAYHYQDINCQQCPYGGKCQQGITAVANFWGYIHQNQVRFQHCPKGYCCSGETCESYSTCAAHRTGMLCGSCEEGYSEALFSSQCVKDDNCDSTWLWPLALASGFLYALFLLFQKDVRDLMFLNSVTLKDIRLPWRKTEVEFRLNNMKRHHGDQLSYGNKYGLSTRPLKDEDEIEQFTSEAETIETNIDHSNENNNINLKRNDDTDDKNKAEDEPPPDTGAGFLIILFYYFQDAQLLHIKTVFAEEENKTRDMFKQILSGLFKFRVEIFQFMDKFCFLGGLTPTNKLLIKVVLVPFVLFLFGLLYMVYRCIMALKGYKKPQRHLNGIGHKLAYYKHPGMEEAIIETQNGNISNQYHTEYQKSLPCKEEYINDDHDEQSKKPFSCKLATGFVLSLLFTYQKLATTSFTLLNCVPVGGQNVLFIQGTVTCYTMWQYGVMAYTGSCIVPFCLVLLIGPGLLKDGIISIPQFFCACLFPLPFLIHWFIIRMKLRGHKPQSNFSPSEESKAVMSILQGPFKDSENKLFGPICGAGVLIGRRLILILLYTFVNDTLIRMLCMMMFCFIMLLHHVHVLPYKDTRGNIAGSASAAALLIVGGINLVRAGFEAAEYTPQGPNKSLMQIFEHTENVLMLWIPAAVMGFAILSMTVKIGLLCLKRCSKPQH